ncbi:MAG: hypothetical protein JWO83_1294 [Caulobacteraceae bacterium]|nr:hypothetical protein [Caulobacteraceae bacterium]
MPAHARPPHYGLLLLGAYAGALSLAPMTAAAKPREGVEARLKRINALLAAQALRIQQQEDRLAAEEREIARQRAELAELRARQAAPPQNQAAAGVVAPPLPSAALAQNAAPPPPPTPAPSGPTAALPARPVGQAPETNIKPVVLASIPQNLGVLTPRHHFVFEPGVEYDRVGTNRLVFEGVEIVPGLQLGLVNANSVAADVVIGTADLRYGVTNRLELEAKVPYFYNHDRLTFIAQQVTTGAPPVNMTTNLQGYSLGDVEFAARYQINRAQEGKPVWIASLRARADTGIGPYDVHFNSSGIATSLPTGSGFWGVEPGMTMLLPIDPVVLFANAGYMRNFPGNVNKTIGLTHVGHVSPGDSVDTSFGFAFALNPSFSYSLGFSNSYIFGASQQLNATVLHSNDLEVGSLTLGLSFRVRRNLLLTTNLQFGVTPDAPNLQVIFRMPLSF